MSDTQKPLPTFAALQQRNVQEQLTPEEAVPTPAPVEEAVETAPIKPKTPRKNVQMYKSTNVQKRRSGEAVALDASTLAEVREALLAGWRADKDANPERLVADIPAELHAWMKAHCASQGVSIKNLLLALLFSYRQAAEEDVKKR